MLNYEIIKNDFKEWVIFVHGMGGSTNTWNRQIDDFSKKYNLLLIDLPGHGKSKGKIKANMIENVNKEIKNLMNHLKIKKANFVGMSLGCTVIANFAVKYPAKVSSIIFGGAAIKTTAFYAFFMDVVKKIKKILPFRFTYNLFASVIMPRKRHKLSRTIFIKESLKMTKDSFLKWLDFLCTAAHQNELIQKLAATKIKMLFISGDEDACFIGGAKKAAKSVNAAFATIRHCGHVCTIEKAKEFNKMALRFLRGTDQETQAAV